MRETLKITYIISCILFIAYALIGTSHNVNTIKERVPKEINKRGWKILRYEGYQFGSFESNGGKVWYHVQDTANPNIQYRIHVCLWNDELQWYYNSPENLTRIEIKK